MGADGTGSGRHGLSTEVSLAVPPGSLPFWEGHLQRSGVSLGAAEVRFGEHALPLVDPHALRLALVESASSLSRPFAPWTNSPVPPEHQIRGLKSARMSEASRATTSAFLEETMGFRLVGAEDSWHRFAVGEGKSGQYVDVRELPGGSPRRVGHWGHSSSGMAGR